MPLKRKEYARGPVRQPDVSDDPDQKKDWKKALRELKPRDKYGHAKAADKDKSGFANVESVLISANKQILKDLPPAVPPETKTLLTNLFG
jgi:hypothetical protein